LQEPPGFVGHVAIPSDFIEAADTTVIEAKSIKIQTIDAIKCTFFISFILSFQNYFSDSYDKLA
jgi:hypothetical protein